MKISEVAKAINLPISTVRYYEKIGIITDEYVLRDQNNYRTYAPDIIQYLEVVKQCLSIGFTIRDIQSMISKNGFSKSEQNNIIIGKILELEEAQKSLEASKQNLVDILNLDITCKDGFGKY